MRTLGNRGEELAALELEQAGYRIVHRNWRCARGEIDIIAWDGNTLVFIEVKTRRQGRCGDGMQAVDLRKQKKIRQLALTYIHETTTSASTYRFDVVAVDGNSGEVTIIYNAF